MSLEYVVIMAAIVMAIICIVMIFYVRTVTRQHSRRLDEMTKHMDAVQHASRLQQEALHEVRTGALAVGAKVKDLMLNVTQLGDKVAEIEYLDPETRLYAQAAKMVDAGATVEDLMRECELPRAEAELLISVKKR